MIDLKYRRTDYCVPILTKDEIDEAGEQIIKDYDPAALSKLHAIDIDAFAQDYLHQEQDFQWLSHNGCYLGMTVFNDTNQIVVYNMEENKAEYISEKGGTIIIDNRLLEKKQEHRYRYTMGHECGHVIWHSDHFNFMNLIYRDSTEVVRCRLDTSLIENKDRRKWNTNDWMEWQANMMASALLMPKTAVFRMAEIMSARNKNCGQYLLDCIMVKKCSELFCVSEEAAIYRLQGFGLIKNDIRPHEFAVEGIRPHGLGNWEYF